ncbi:hypothetical protein [Portibacter marinus]|uniref:hypothetical protein n=1 Tax=Portibacter marinus TaxID=2898660 RepID=UPI001F1D7B1B|nr:hypothetical protein [Portibacter marinus]
MKALQINSSSVTQKYIDYINASNDVFRYAHTINIMEMPDLGMPPLHYGDFVNEFAEAKLDTNIWISEVIPDITQAPKSIVDINGLVQKQLSALSDEIDLLAKSPGNQDVINSIKAAVSQLLIEEQKIYQVFEDIHQNITNYKNTIQPDAEKISALISEIKNAVDYDQAQVDKLDAVNQNLQQNIDARNQLVTLDKFGNAILPVFLAGVGIALAIAFTGPAGIIIGGIVGVGGAVFTSFVSENNEPNLKITIDDLQQEMTNVTAEIGIETTTIGILNHVENQFKKIVTASDKIVQESQQTLDFWDARIVKLNTLKEELEGILDHFNNVADLKALIADAIQNWQKIEEDMKVLSKVEYHVETIRSSALNRIQKS